MLFGLLDRLVKSFSISRLIVISLLARLIAYLILPSTPSFLAPDEGTYANLAKWVAESRDVQEYPGYGPNLYATGKTLILPASWLIRIGIHELTSTRFVSIFYGVMSIFLFAKIMFLLLGVKEIADLPELRIQRTAISGILVFAFLPSNFIWSTLGLRESVSMAMTLSTIFLLLKLKFLNSQIGVLKSSIFLSLMAIGAIVLSFGARRETAVVFIVFFCTLLIFGSSRQTSLCISAVVLLGTSFGILFSTSPSTQTISQFVWSPSESVGRLDIGPSASKLCSREGQIISTVWGDRVCNLKVVKFKSLSISNVTDQSPIKNLDDFAYKREVNRLDALTALPKTKCLNSSLSSLSKAKCALSELPFRLVSVLFRPFLGVDTGSLVNNLASLENLVWTFLVLTFFLKVYSSLKHKIHLDFVVPASVFMIAFSSLAALYEGNLGTAFRHKSTILWCLILVITLVISGQWQKSQKEVTQNKPCNSREDFDD